MIAIIILSILLAMIIYSIAIIRLKLCKNTTWYKVSFAVAAWFLFLFIVIEAMIYTDHNLDHQVLNKYSKVIKELKEKEDLAETVLSFVISKYPSGGDIKISKIETADKFFQNIPDLENEEVDKVLTDYLEKKAKRTSIEKKIEERTERILYRSNNPWVLILPKTD